MVKIIILNIIRKFVHALLFWSKKKIPGLDVRDVIIEVNPEIPKQEKEALLILPGLGDSPKGRRHQKRFFSERGFDLYIPDFHDTKSYELTVKKFEDFFKEHKLKDYKKIHVFSYILGSWVLNDFIEKQGGGNFKTIIYDRSPLQERASKIAIRKLPRFSMFIAGILVDDFSKIPYPPLIKNDIRVGVLVESKATRMIRMFKDMAMSMGPIVWDDPITDQEYDDLIYTRLNHDELYYSFDEIGGEIMAFIKKGVFTKEAKRDWYDWDPFVKYKKGQ